MTELQDMIDRLSEEQRICLRLVNQHMSSKDIARRLDISPHTIDQRIKVAMRHLGVTSRTKAAIMLAEFEGSNMYQPLVHQRSDIVGTGQTPPLSPPAHQAGHDAGSSGMTLHEQQMPFEVFGAAVATGSAHFPAQTGGGRNDLTIIQRLGVIAMIAIGSALSFGAVLAGLEALSRLS